jgi:carboxymethylenebutenolidase
MPIITSSLEPKQLSHPDVIPAVWGVLETPPTPGSHAGVLLLPGSSGWQSAYLEIAKTLADSGIVALAIDYYAETGSATSPEDRLRKWPLWQATVRNAVTYLQTSPWVSGRHVGLVGYSQGAFLAVSVASSLPAVMAVVDFFGGRVETMESLEQEVRVFPSLLIIHGESDTIVPVESAYRLRETVIAHGGEVEMHIYPGAQHAFNAPWSPMFSEPEASDSLRRMIEFLRRRLGE